MGNKTKPQSLRLGITGAWQSAWFPKKETTQRYLEEDLLIRETILQKVKEAGIDSIVIERTPGSYKVLVKTSRPGLVIGRGGKGVEELIGLLESRLKKLRHRLGAKEKISLNLTIGEIKRLDVSASVIAQSIATDLERRIRSRRTMRKYLDQIVQNRGVQGAKIRIAGRLNGAEIARSEQLTHGKLPLQNLRANIDYGEATAFTIYGTIGAKVWIYKGEIFKGKKE